MAEYLAVNEQAVQAGQPVIFTASIPCPRGNVYHEDETGIFILRGAATNVGARFARYQVTYNGNIAVATGGTVGPIALAIAVNGETRPSSLAIYTPAAVDTYGNVTVTAIITVPAGCCFTLSVRSVPAAPGATPTVITVANSNLVINRIA